MPRMTCHACGRALPEDARFCSGCGVAVARTCAACGAELEAGDRFCRRCGTPTDRADDASVLTSPPREPREASRERKVATLLFADLVGFTSMNEAHDPELVSSVVSTAFERLADEVRRYEGTVEKFAGDAMLAVFGVPTTHEDDPERAVRAALEMQTALAAIGSDASGGPELRLRIGIATGEVLADRSRVSGERDLFVTGDAVNTASRIQAAAEPGTVVVGPSTYAATRDAIEYEELPPVALKGKELPVAVWRADSVKAGRGGRRGRLGLQAPLVGRDTELSLLKETVRRTVEDGKPHLVTVMGSAGVGKSRIAWELEKYLDGLPDVFHWRKGRCPAYSSTSFGPIADVAKADARIADDDSPMTAREKLAHRLVELEPVADDAEVRRALEAVLAIGDGTEHPRDELFEAWRRYLGAVAGVAPLVLVLEDIHWADEGVLAFIEFLARWGEGPIVIVCLARHELLEKRATWGGGLPNAATIVLEPLGAEDSSALVGGLLDGDVPEQLGSRLIDLAEGNPLFVEELVRMLVDRGVLRFAEGRWDVAGAVEQLQIPDSVQAVLAARLDTLPPEEKRVAQDAAVVGRIFWDVIVAHLAGSERDPTHELIRRLRVKDLVVQRSPSALADAAEFGFRHVLIRDVAYDSLPKRDRSRLHRDVAAWAESELSDRIDEFSELIAGHLAAALAYEEEFSDDPLQLRVIRESTYAAAKRAVQRAQSLSQYDASNRWLRLALELAWKIDAPPREIADLTTKFAVVAWQTADPVEAELALTRAIDAWRPSMGESDDDRLLMAHLRDKRGNAIFGQGDVERSREELRNAIAELEPGPPSAARALLLNRYGWTYWRAGPVEEAIPIIERAVAEAEASGAEGTLRWAKHDLAISLALVGRRTEGIALLEESLELARAAGDRELQLRGYVNLPATLAQQAERIEEIEAMSLEGLQLARRLAGSQYITWLAGNRADHLLELGRVAEAEEQQSEGIAHAERISFLHLGSQYCSRALLRLLLGDREGSARDIAAGERVGIPEELQVAWSHPLSVAVYGWDEDPRRSADALLAWASEHIDGMAPTYTLTVELARMAVRLGDAATLEEAVRLIDLHTTSRDVPPQRARTAWAHGLVAGDPVAVAAAATTLEDLGLKFEASEAWCDAALLAARAGVGSPAAAHAAELLEEMGIRPWLGPMPETRWVEPAKDLGEPSAA